MYAFLVHFHQRLPLVKKLGLAGLQAHHNHYHGPQYMRYKPLDDIFPLLIGAANMEALYLHKWIFATLSRRAPHAATMLYQQAHGWMRALAVSKGNRLAALDVIKLPAVENKARQTWSCDAVKQAEFRSELAGQLTAT